MKLKRTLSILLICALVLAMTGCKKAEETTPTTAAAVATEASFLPAQEQYAAARAAVDSASEVSVRITREKSTTVGGELFLEKSEQILNMTGRGTDSQKILLGESVSYGDAYGAIYQETYADGVLYVLADGAYRMSGDVEPQTYLNSLVPAVLLDESLYGSVEYLEDGSIRFSQPVSAEAWAMPEGAEFGNATGSVTLNADGSLAESSYTVSYDYGSAQVTESITSTVTLKSAEIFIPGDAVKYVKVQDIKAVRMAKQAMGFLKQAQGVSATVSESILDVAAGMTRTQETSIDLYDGPELAAKITTNVSLANYTTSENQTHSQEEMYKDGMYTINTNGAGPVQKPEVTADVITRYCDSSFADGVIMPEYWKDARIEEVGDIYLVECTFNESLDAKLRSYMSEGLLSDVNAANSVTSNVVTLSSTGYFAVDKYTGLPTAAGYLYSSADASNPEGTAKVLEHSQTYHAPNLSVYYTLTGQMLPEKEPASKATPLLYRVTGNAGQEMYLMGTIHVGDERTAYLPQQVYDALNASQALAVEADPDAFALRMATNSEIQGLAMACYFYSDGTTIADHVNAETLAQAQRYLKVTGNKEMYFNNIRAGQWANTLENFFLRQSYHLVAEKGMDSRLLALAKQQGKEIVEIESGELQLVLMASYSDGVQEMLLKEAVSYSPNEFAKETENLYETWCRGDEAAMRQLLAESADTSDMTAEEKALFAEYFGYTIQARNLSMLEAAKTHLESGKTVFFAVGTAHLLQDNGLVDTLRQAGYTVEQVLYQ